MLQEKAAVCMDIASSGISLRAKASGFFSVHGPPIQRRAYVFGNFVITAKTGSLSDALFVIFREKLSRKPGRSFRETAATDTLSGSGMLLLPV
jgi:hypothetical protein